MSLREFQARFGTEQRCAFQRPATEGHPNRDAG
jgi:hypothetical protein